MKILLFVLLLGTSGCTRIVRESTLWQDARDCRTGIVKGLTVCEVLLCRDTKTGTWVVCPDSL